MLSVRSLIASIPYARYVKNRVDSIFLQRARTVSFPRDRMKPSCSHEAVQGGHKAALSEDTFILYRIVGNDLEPRHKKGQSRENLAFILEHEPELERCEKRFIVNRIVDPVEEQRILEMLDNAGYPYIHIPFKWEEYSGHSWDIPKVVTDRECSSGDFFDPSSSFRRACDARLYRLKNNYVMNNNGARNVALRDGRARAKWVLPWDGNCYVTDQAWRAILTSIAASSDFSYHIVPMTRITDNKVLLDPEFKPVATEEPQVIFRNDANQEFNPEYCYGRRPKVELFWRLGVPGDWDHWPIESWDLQCPEYSKDYGNFFYSGWVARLFSGKPALEQQLDLKAAVARGDSRNEAIMDMLDSLDTKARGVHLDPDRFIFVPSKAAKEFSSSVLEEVVHVAGRAVTRGPFSVIEKTSLPPSGNRHDYWHPAPYYWPNPLKIPGLPYVRRDGHRVSGTIMYEPESEKYDRTSLQRLFDDTYAAALAWLGSGEGNYGIHGADLVRHWFLEPETAMTPHLKYAQVRRGHDNNLGACSGIIEFKDLYYFLDAVRILRKGEFLTGNEFSRFKAWMGEYLDWLMNSRQGAEERASPNNHGTYYDLQVAAICAFLGEENLLRQTLRDSRFRILTQFSADGKQPCELQRTNTAHYCCFNLQGWIHLAQLAESIGEDLWHFTGKAGNGIKKGMEWLLAHDPQDWPYPQVNSFDVERFAPIAFWYQRKYGSTEGIASRTLAELSSVKPIFHPHDGIMPFWSLSGLGVDLDGGRSVASEALLQ